jgi:hypothetical protein
VWFARACQRDPDRRFATAAEMSEALRSLDRLARERSDDIQYRIRPAEPSVHDAISIPIPPTPSRVRTAAAVILGASLAVGALGMFVWKRTDEANRAILEASRSAQAAVEAENERRLASERAAAVAAQAAQAQSQDAAAPLPGRPRHDKRP